MVLNATFNNISVISWPQVLLVEETRVHRENHRPVASHLVVSVIWRFNLTVEVKRGDGWYICIC